MTHARFDKTHGKCTLSGVLAMAGLVLVSGCAADENEPPEGAIRFEDRPQPQVDSSEREEVASPQLGQVLPVATTGDEVEFAHMVVTDELLRIVEVPQRGESRVVFEQPVEAGTVISIDRLEGLRVGNREVLPGPLSRQSEFQLFYVPEEAGRTVTRTTRIAPGEPSKPRQSEP